MKNKIKDLALLAVLEYEAISGVSVVKHSNRSVSQTSTPSELLKDLTEFYSTLCYFDVDFQIIIQVFKQVRKKINIKIMLKLF